MTLDVQFARRQFPGLDSEWIFFDNAGGSQILKGAIDRINEYYLNNNVQHGGSYAVSQNAMRALYYGRTDVATLFNAAKPEEIVFGGSSTVLTQNLAKAMESSFKAGDEIILTNADHETNIGAWAALEKKGVIIKFWEMNTETYELEIDKLKSLLGDKTKLVCFTHVSNILGTINPVKEITKLVHQYDAKVCVDGVGYAPHRAVDVQDWDVDFYFLSLYKTYGPHHAALYGKYELLLELDSIYHYFYPKDKVPTKLEPGNPNYELSYASSAIIDYLAELGTQVGSDGNTREKLVAAFDRITDQETLLCERLLSYLRGRNDCTIIGRTNGNDANRIPIISFTVDGKDPEEICKRMDQYRIAIRFGDFHARRLIEALDLGGDKNGVVRVSMAHYNGVEEVDALTIALDKVLSD